MLECPTCSCTCRYCHDTGLVGGAGCNICRRPIAPSCSSPCEWPGCRRDCSCRGAGSTHYCNAHRPAISEESRRRLSDVAATIKAKQLIIAYAFADAVQSLARWEPDDLDVLRTRVDRKRAELHELAMRDLAGCPLCGPLTCACT